MDYCEDDSLKTKQCFYISCSSPYWVDIAKQLQQKHDWQPLYWSGLQKIKPLVEETFPNIYFHESMHAVRGNHLSLFEKNPHQPIDTTLLHALGDTFLIALQMMNRMDRKNLFGFQERCTLFYSYVHYWSVVLDQLQPDLIIFPVSPHIIFDYVLYSLCKQKQIPTILFQQTSLPNLLYPVQQFEKGNPQLITYYQQLLTTASSLPLLSEENKKHVQQIKGDYETAIPFYTKDQTSRKNPLYYACKKIMTNPDNLQNIIHKGYYLFTRDHYIKTKDQPIQSSNSKQIHYLFMKLEGIQKKNKLKHYYQTLVQPIDYHRPFVYFPLHYQPENTTSPQGGIYADQFLVIDMISQLLPKGWILYVKEHPAQWHPLFHGECSRDITFYEQVNNMPNVSFVSTTLPSFDVIDHAQAVVTITGTSGWEALLRGIPVLLFGDAWYTDCQGAFRIHTTTDCNHAISLITNKYVVNEEHVLLFIKTLETIGVQGYVEDAYQQVSTIPYEENVETIAETINQFYTTRISS